MEAFIDNFSKRLAKAVTRRDLLSITSRTLFAAVMARFWTGSTATAAPSCPSCGTCQACNVQSGQCDKKCPDPCTAARLCTAAQQAPAYVTLQNFLGVQFTVGTPEALVLIDHPDK